ncbi:MAG: DUF4388 domain-containing protein [Deltaproteobacteria bacterium]|nr:DUF4388 domain-containing protein [Deltaproteobacteria bacterium]
MTSSPDAKSPPFPAAAGPLDSLLADPTSQADGVPVEEVENHLDGDTDESSTLDEANSFLKEETRKTLATEEVKYGAAIEALLKAGVIGQDQLKSAAMENQEGNEHLLEALFAGQHVDEERAQDALAASAKVHTISKHELESRAPSAEICRKLPQTYATSRRLLPLLAAVGQSSRRTFDIAVVDPFAQGDIDEVKRLLGAVEVHVVVAARSALIETLRNTYHRHSANKVSGQHGILLCSDDDKLVERLGGRLVAEGFQVELCATVEEARAALRGRMAHAVLFDAQLEGGAYTAFLLEVRADDRLDEMPFFVFGDGDDEEVESCALDLGADDFFEKPINLKRAVSKLRRASLKFDKQVQAAIAKTAPLPVAEDASNVPRNAPKQVTMVGIVPGIEALRDMPSSIEGGFEGFGDGPLPFDGSSPFDEVGDNFGDDDGGFAEPTGVMGTLRQMSVSEIVQSLEFGRKTARVEFVPSDGERGSVSFLDGAVVAAECGGVKSDQAFYTIARNLEGFFRIHYGDRPTETNIDKPTTFLLHEAMRLMDKDAGIG